MAWTLAQAKDQLADIVALAKTEGPQVVDIDGETRGVIVTPEQWSTGRAHPVDVENLDYEGSDDEFKALLVTLGSGLDGLDPERPVDEERSF